MAAERTTRQRLLDASVSLMAEHGFDGVAVGDIEAAVGLQPRRGALYRHFPSKQALLEDVVRTELEAVGTAARQIDELDLSSAEGAEVATLEPIIEALGSWFLSQLDRLRDLTRIVEHDGSRLPGLLEELRAGLSDQGYRSAARLIAAVRPDIDDPETLAYLLLAPLLAARRTEWTFGAPPLGLDDTRLLRRWTRHVITTVEAAATR